MDAALPVAPPPPRVRSVNSGRSEHSLFPQAVFDGAGRGRRMLLWASDVSYLTTPLVHLNCRIHGIIDLSHPLNT